MLEEKVGNRAVTIRPSRGGVFLLLFLAFDLAYLATPYWSIPGRTWQKLVLLALSSALGLWWAYAAAGQPAWRTSRGSVAWLVATMLPLAALNARAMLVGIPWRGDEDFHVTKVVRLLQTLSPHPAFLLIAAVVLCLVVGLAWRRSAVSRWLWVFCTVLVILEAVVVLLVNLPAAWGMVRYPFFSYWFAAVPLLAVGSIARTGPPFTGWLPEPLLRLVPFLSAVFLGYLGTIKLPEQPRATRLLGALAIGTMPLVLYYSSILYLEMPAVLLATVVCFAAGRLLTADPDELPHNASWYALLLIGYIKESTLPFLASFVVCRCLVRLRILGRQGIRLRRLLQEAQVALAVLLPLGIFLFYRTLGGVRRQFSPHALNLMDPTLYLVVVRSYVEQFGPLALLSVAGLAALVVRRRFVVLLFLLVAFSADALFHLLDQPGFVGYSRLNLFLLPPLIAAAREGVDLLAARATLLASVLLSGVIAANLLMSPINLDGAKRPNWGQYLIDTSEHYYPSLTDPTDTIARTPRTSPSYGIAPKEPCA